MFQQKMFQLLKHFAPKLPKMPQYSSVIFGNFRQLSALAGFFLSYLGRLKAKVTRLNRADL